MSVLGIEHHYHPKRVMLGLFITFAVVSLMVSVVIVPQYPVLNMVPRFLRNHPGQVLLFGGALGVVAAWRWVERHWDLLKYTCAAGAGVAVVMAALEPEYLRTGNASVDMECLPVAAAALVFWIVGSGVRWLLQWIVPHDWYERDVKRTAWKLFFFYFVVSAWPLSLMWSESFGVRLMAVFGICVLVVLPLFALVQGVQAAGQWVRSDHDLTWYSTAVAAGALLAIVLHYGIADVDDAVLDGVLCTMVLITVIVFLVSSWCAWSIKCWRISHK